MTTATQSLFSRRTTAIACGTLGLLIAGGAARADFDYPNFSSTSGLSLVGVATKSATSNNLLVTPSVGASAGAVWAVQKQQIAGGFDTTFVLHIEDKHGGGADGLALVIQNSSPTALGGTGGAMGYGRNLVYNQPGISNSLAVAFDMWPNSPQDWEEAGDNHVTIQTRGLLENTPDLSASLGNAALNDLSGGESHLVRIIYTAGIMSVYVDASLTPVLQREINLSQLLALDNGTAWVGITAATGGAGDREAHVIEGWNFHSCPIPTPGAASLLMLGGLVGSRRRRTVQH